MPAVVVMACSAATKWVRVWEKNNTLQSSLAWVKQADDAPCASIGRASMAGSARQHTISAQSTASVAGPLCPIRPPLPMRCPPARETWCTGNLLIVLSQFVAPEQGIPKRLKDCYQAHTFNAAKPLQNQTHTVCHNTSRRRCEPKRFPEFPTGMHQPSPQVLCISLLQPPPALGQRSYRSLQPFAEPAQSRILGFRGSCASEPTVVQKGARGYARVNLAAGRHSWSCPTGHRLLLALRPPEEIGDSGQELLPLRWWTH